MNVITIVKVINNRQYNIDKRNSDNIFNIKHNIIYGHNEF